MATRMKVLGIIPARMGSTRFPGKPLALINGIPMITTVYYNALKSTLIDDLYVATCDQEIIEHVNSIGGNCVLTSPTHDRASDRCAEALDIIEELKSSRYDIVAMLQGDEPLINAQMIDAAISPLISDESVLVSNLMSPITNNADLNSPNCIKVVANPEGNAIYFSRSCIPSSLTTMHYKQVCVIPFRASFLRKYAQLSPTPLEQAESIDMLRVLESGFNVRMIETTIQTHPVDVPDDIVTVTNMLQSMSQQHD